MRSEPWPALIPRVAGTGSVLSNGSGDGRQKGGYLLAVALKWGGLFACLLTPLIAVAESGVAPVQAESQHVLAASADRLGVGVSLEKDRALAFSCESECRSGNPQLTVSLPAEVQTERPKIQILKFEKGASLLWVRYGDADHYYSVLIAGGKRGEGVGQIPEAPVLVLKGWAGKESKSQSELFELQATGSDRLQLVGVKRSRACGREVPSSTRVYDPELGRFRRVSASLLSPAERESASTLSAQALDKPDGELLVGLEAQGEDSSLMPVDGDQMEPWSQGHAFVELKSPPGQSLSRLALVMSSPLTEATSFWLLSDEQVYRVVLPATEKKSFAVDLPFEAPPGCVTLVQPRAPVPLAEVLMRVSVAEPPSTEALVRELSNADPGLAPDALRVRGVEAGSELSKAFPRMSTMARARALEIATTMPRTSGAIVFAAGLEFGSDFEKAESLAVLKTLGAPGIQAVVTRLSEAQPAGRVRLSQGLAGLSIADAVKELAPFLGEGSSAERLELRRIYARVAGTKEAKKPLEALLREQATSQHLSKEAQIELVRALLPHLTHWDTLTEPLVQRLSQQASFEEAYRLAPAVLTFASRNDELKTLARAWLQGTRPSNASETQRAALSVRMLELMRESKFKKAQESYAQEVPQLLSSPNVRVRRASFEYLSEVPGLVTPDEIISAMKEDPWPEVRARAAAAAVTFSPGGEEAQELTRFLSRRMARDEHALARRGIAQALGQLGGKTAIKALRKALEEDDFYEVRAEAALSLGDACDHDSVNVLTDRAQALSHGVVGEGPLLVGLAAVTSLKRLNPPDLKQRMAPLLSKKVSGVLRNQVRLRLEDTTREPCPAARVSP